MDREQWREGRNEGDVCVMARLPNPEAGTCGQTRQTPLPPRAKRPIRFSISILVHSGAALAMIRIDVVHLFSGFRSKFRDKLNK